MPRPIWKGYITFGLVSIPVILFPAEKKEDIHFHLIDTRNKARIRYMRVNEATHKEVPWEEVAKGYEYNDHDYILLTEEDLKSIATENSKTINIESFIDQKSLDNMDFDKPYYLVPDKRGEKGYVILRETLQRSKKIGITRVVIHTRQYLAALMSYKNALVLYLLRYHNEIKKPTEFELPSTNLKQYKISAKELEVAEQLITAMTAKWQPEDYKNEYKAMLQDWIDEKIKHAGKPRKKTAAVQKPTNVIDFVDLLKKSLHEGKGKNKSNKKAPKKMKTSRK